MRYEQIYRGVDLLFHGDQTRLEYDFVVRPGAKVSVIELAFDGIESLSIDADGDLVLRSKGGVLRQQRPIVYQTDAQGSRKSIEGTYAIRGRSRVGFRVGNYDTARDLVIDPTLSYSSYLGGSSSDRGLDLALDSSGNIYLTGYTGSTNFPTANARQPASGGGTDAFVTKLDPSGTTMLFSTYLGGSGTDEGESLALDSLGNAYVMGETGSTNFPTVGALQTTNRGGRDLFVAKLSPAGDTLV